MKPLGPPKSTQDRLKSPLDTLFFQKSDFSKTIVKPQPKSKKRRQDGTQNNPRSPRDGSKTIFETFFFRLRFCLRFWSLLGRILAPSWHYVGSSWLHFGPSGRSPGPFFIQSGAKIHESGAIMDHLGFILARLPRLARARYQRGSAPGRPWMPSYLPLGPYGPILAYLGLLLAPSWPHLGPIFARRRSEMTLPPKLNTIF